jgi:hypothetical protein
MISDELIACKCGCKCPHMVPSTITNPVCDMCWNGCCNGVSQAFSEKLIRKNQLLRCMACNGTGGIGEKCSRCFGNGVLVRNE